MAESTASGWWWARRDTRWDVYPQTEPLVRLRVEPDGPGFVKMFHENGAQTRVGYVLVSRVAS